MQKCIWAVAQLEVWTNEQKLSWSLAEVATSGPLTNNEKSWEMIVNPDMDFHTKTRINHKTLRKTKKNTELG